METTIKAAVVHKTWIDAAREELKDAALRCEYYDAIFDLYFDEQLKLISSPIAQAMFTMTRPYILADKERYRSKCERNRQNALSRANASERKRSLPVADYNNNNSNSSNISNNNNNNNNLSLTSDEQRERERFDILGVLFGHAALDVQAEMQRFVDYYAAQGWRTSKGAQIVSKRHAARQWQIKSAHEDKAPYAAWYNAFATSRHLPAAIWTGIKAIAVHTKGVVSVYLTANDDFITMLETKCAKQLTDFGTALNCERIMWERTTS